MPLFHADTPLRITHNSAPYLYLYSARMWDIIHQLHHAVPYILVKQGARARLLGFARAVLCSGFHFNPQLASRADFWLLLTTAVAIPLKKGGVPFS